MLDLDAAGVSQVHALAESRLATACAGPGIGLSQSGSGVLVVLAEPRGGMEALGSSESDMGINGRAHGAERGKAERGTTKDKT